MGQLKDLTGQKFGKLTVLRRAEDRKRAERDTVLRLSQAPTIE